MKKRNTILVLIALIASIFFTLIYLSGRILIFSIAKYCWYEKVIGISLLLSECFILIHGIGYFLEIIKVTIQKRKTKEKKVSLKTHPLVTVVIPSFNEPLDILEQTIIACYNMTYAEKHIVLLDDTKYEETSSDYKRKIEQLCKKWNIALFRRQWRGAKAGILNDFISFIRKEPKQGSSYQEFGNKINPELIKYLVIFDADQNPFLDFLEPLVARMEKNSKLAFIQTPQYYTNFEENKVAKAAGLQQAIFYEYICEGKSISDSMYCCGTNVIFRLKALIDIGGFDESSVTEDFATSLKFHLNKWSTSYYPKVGAFGMGPEDLGSYFKQQYRWSLGTITLLKSIIFQFFKNPRKISFTKWWEYFLSGSYYLVGFVFFTFMICPVLFLFFNVPSYFANIKFYVMLFLPYFIMAIGLYFSTLKQRGYATKDILMGQVLLTQCFPVYIKATIDAFLGRKRKFEITKKGESKSLSLIFLWPQLLMLFFCFIAVIWGFNRMYFEPSSSFAIEVNVFWSIYNFFILSYIFYFNKPCEQRQLSENI